MQYFFIQIADTNHLIRNVKVECGAMCDQGIWNGSIIKKYLCSLRANEEIMRNEGEYYLIGIKTKFII